MGSNYIPAGVAVAGVVLAGTSSALAQTHYFTQGDTLYSSEDGGPLSSVTISAGGIYPGLAFDPFGTLWASNSFDDTFYTIDPVTGAATPQFSYGGVTGGIDIVSFDFRDVEGKGFLQIIGMAHDTAYVFDAFSGIFLGSNDNFAEDDVHRFPTTAFDHSLFTYYGVSRIDAGLYTLQPDFGSASHVGLLTDSDTQEPVIWDLAGGAFFGGEYWSGFRVGSDVFLGTIDTATAVYTRQFQFSGFDPATGMGYAIIPAPGSTLLLLGAGLLGVSGRRSRKAGGPA